jgi:hypothetical protein
MKLFSNYSDLRPNLDKCEVAGIGVLKGINWALCELKSIDLTKQTIKILGMHFSYDIKLRDKKNSLQQWSKYKNYSGFGVKEV